jgi:spermidine synthase
MPLVVCFSGQGTLSKALLAHPKVERVIAVEHMKRYIPDVQVGFLDLQKCVWV